MLNYFLITKPGIIFGNLITVAAGFLLAAHGFKEPVLLFVTLIGLACVIASACVLNNYIDREIDRKMLRTQNRPLAKGLISGRQALLFAVSLLLLGNFLLLSCTNLLTVLIAGSGFFIYVFVYSFCKVKTVFGTAIGSLAGGVPPLVGYCAMSNRFDLGALLLFAIMVFWQLPHFFSIALYRIEDYTAASIPVLPVKKGILQTKRRMAFYIFCFTVASAMMTFCHYTGRIYLIVTVSLGLLWLFLCFRGFNNRNDRQWARQMFLLSLFIISALSIAIPFDLYSRFS